MNNSGSSQRSQLVLAAVISGVVGGAVSLVFQARRPAADLPTPAHAEVREESAANTAPSPVPLAWERNVEPQPQALATPPAAARHEDAGSHVDIAEQPAQTADEVAANLEGAFQSDARASSKLRQTESVLRGAFSRVDGVTLETLECRSHTCRAEVTFASEAIDVQFTRKIFANPETRLDLDMGVTIPLRTTRPDGSVATTMYFVSPDTDPGLGS
jgi:cytoskeletal protein RodZ